MSSAIRTVKTPDKFVWKCDVKGCRFTASAENLAATEASVERHKAMHTFKVGTKVRLVGRYNEFWPGEPRDTGTISHAYIDQDRFGVVLDRKGKCEGCRHCDGCGGPTKLGCQVKFENLEHIR